MLEESELNYLVHNIINENHYKHCRLCLKEIHENYIKFEEWPTVDVENCIYENISELLKKILGEEICSDIAGVDALCCACADKVVETANFLQMCENSTKLLNKVLDNLVDTLNVDVDTLEGGESLYIVVNEDESNLILVKDEKDIKPEIPIVKIIKCFQCSEVFNTLAEIKEHNHSVHSLLTCVKCFEAFESDKEPMKYVDSDAEHRCPNCKELRSTENSLLRNSHHTYVCKHCGKPFKTLAKLQNHEQKHQIKYECPKCSKTYTTKEFYMRHKKQCLEGTLDPHPMRSKFKKTHFCDKCGKGYSTPGGLRVHNRFVHGNAKPHVCPHCNKQFTAPSYLKIHMIKHTGEKNFACEICFRKFVSKEALIYHTRRHTGERPFSCHLCDERFVNSSARAEHIKFKHVGPTLMCEICSRKFVTPAVLRQHIKKHLDRANKIYSERCLMPPNIPGPHNMTIRTSE